MNPCRIIVFMTTTCTFHDAIMAGMKHRMFALHPECEIEVRVANQAKGMASTEHIQMLTHEDADVVVTIGNHFSQKIAEEFNSRRHPLPTIFCAVGQSGIDFLREQRKSVTYLTGVYPEPQKLHIPLQVVLRLYPEAKSILLPYRKGYKFGRIDYEIQQAQEYCALRQINAIPVCLEESDNITAKLSPQIKSVDIIAALEGALTIETPELEKLCKLAGKPFIGNGYEAVKKNAIFSFEEDARFMGAKVAEVCEQILVHGKKPIDIEPYMVKHARLISSGDATEGVFLSKDVLAFDEQNGRFQDMPSRSVALSMGQETAFSLSAYFLMCWHLKQQPGMLYFMHKHDGWEGMMRYWRSRADLFCKRNPDFAIFLGDEHAHGIWKYCQRFGRAMPPSVVISIGDSRLPRSWHHEVRATGTPLVHIKIPAPNPLAPLRMLQEAAPHMRRVTTVVLTTAGRIPDHLQARLSLVRRACHKDNLELSVIAVHSLSELRAVCEEQITADTTDACFFYHDAIPGHGTASLIDVCRTHNIPVCAGGVSYGQIAPLCYGVNMIALRDTVVDIVHNYLKHHMLPEQLDINLASEKIYAASINSTICSEMGLRVSTLAKQCLVDVMHESEISRGLNASKRTGNEHAMLQQAREQVERTAREIIEKMRQNTF